MLDKLRKEKWAKSIFDRLDSLGAVWSNFKYPKTHEKAGKIRPIFWLALLMGLTFLVLTLVFPPLAILAPIGPSILSVGGLSSAFSAIVPTLIYMVIGAAPVLLLKGFQMKDEEGYSDFAGTVKVQVSFVTTIAFLVVAALFPPVAFLGFSSMFHISIYCGLSWFVGEKLLTPVLLALNDGTNTGLFPCTRSLRSNQLASESGQDSRKKPGCGSRIRNLLLCRSTAKDLRSSSRSSTDQEDPLSRYSTNSSASEKSSFSV